MRTLPLAMALLLIPASAAAQSLVQIPRGSSISLEVLHTSFEDDEEVAFYSGAYFLGGRFELNPRLALVAELPFAHFAYNGDDPLLEDESSTALGNPLVGLAVLTDRADLVFGGRLPLAPDGEEASLYGVMTDQYRLEAFVPDLATVQVSARLRNTVSDVTRVTLDLGGVLLVPTDEGEVDFVADYGVVATYVAERVRLGGGVNGRALLTSGADDIGAMTEHQVAVFADFGSGRVRPGLSLRLPLDDNTRDFVDMTLGLTLQLLLP